MATPTLRYVEPTTPAEDLANAPEPVRIYDLPTGTDNSADVTALQTALAALTTRVEALEAAQPEG